MTTVKTKLVAGVIAFASLAAVPASAENLYLGFGDRHGNPGFGIQLGDQGNVQPRERRDWRREGRGCSPGRALDKAEQMGIYRARVDDVSEDSITVRGRHDGERVRVTFARERGCPLIG
jgi:hypothetical protein